MSKRAEESIRELSGFLNFGALPETTIFAEDTSNCALMLTCAEVLRMEWRAPLCPYRENQMWIAASAVGIPTPSLRFEGVFDGRKWMRYNRLPGTTEHSRPALRAAGELLARLHTASVSAFPVDLIASPRRMNRYVDALAACDRGEVPTSWRQMIELAAEDWEHKREVPTHGDFRSSNFLTVGDRVCGVIDWSDGRLSTRERDLGSIDSESFSEVLFGYLRGTQESFTLKRHLILGHSMARYAALQTHRVVSVSHASTSVATIQEQLLRAL